MKKIKILASIICMIAIMSTGVISVSAADYSGNYSDSSFTFTRTNYIADTGATTEPRQKRNATSSYMKYSSVYAPHPYYMDYVSTPKYDASVYVYARQPDEGACPIGSPWYTFTYTGQSRYMTNYVYERGYREACIYVTNATRPCVSSGFDITFFTVWSPDSI